MSYANMDSVPTQTAGTSELLASDWNTYVRDNFDSIKFGHVVCTSSTRPTGIAEGTMIYETDTQKVLVYNGSSWFEVHDLDNEAGLPSDGAALSVIGNGTNSAGSRTDLEASTDGHVLRRSGTTLGFGTIASSALPNGSVVQVVQAGYSTQTTKAGSTTFTDTGLSASITPSATSNKVLVIVHQTGIYKTGSDIVVDFRLLRGATDLNAYFERGAGGTGDTSANYVGGTGVVYLDTPSTTSSTTYKTQYASNSAAGTIGVQMFSSYASISLLEIKA